MQFLPTLNKREVLVALSAAVLLSIPIFFNNIGIASIPLIIATACLSIISISQLYKNTTPLAMLLILALSFLLYYGQSQHIEYYSMTWGVAGAFIIATIVNFIYSRIRKEEAFSLYDRILFTLGGMFIGFLKLTSFIVIITVINILLSLIARVFFGRKEMPISISISMAIYAAIIELNIFF